MTPKWPKNVQINTNFFNDGGGDTTFDGDIDSSMWKKNFSKMSENLGIFLKKGNFTKMSKNINIAQKSSS